MSRKTFTRSESAYVRWLTPAELDELRGNLNFAGADSEIRRAIRLLLRSGKRTLAELLGKRTAKQREDAMRRYWATKATDADRQRVASNGRTGGRPTKPTPCPNGCGIELPVVKLRRHMRLCALKPARKRQRLSVIAVFSHENASQTHAPGSGDTQGHPAYDTASCRL